jgi:uncharacterized membrane-anchored protein
MTRRRLFAALVLLHALVLAGWAATLEQARARAAHVRLEVRPVDPRDMLRGDYIWLSYAISTLGEEQLVGRRPDWSDLGQPVYVALGPRDGLHVIAAASLDRATLPLGPGQRLLVGRLTYRTEVSPGRGAPSARGVVYGIERYYVPEGKGFLPPGRREAEVAITADGRAFLVRLYVDGAPYP